jgi:hypothetical protein
MVVAVLDDQRAFQRTLGADELNSDSRIAGAKGFSDGQSGKKVSPSTATGE